MVHTITWKEVKKRGYYPEWEVYVMEQQQDLVAHSTPFWTEKEAKEFADKKMKEGCWDVRIEESPMGGEKI